MFQRISLSFGVLGCLLVASVANVFASSMNNQTYQLEIGNITNHRNQADKFIEPNKATATILRGSLKAPTSPLTVGLSQDKVAFGPLSPADPINLSTTFFITSAFPVSLYLMQIDSLRTGKFSIPDTTCDTGDCTIDQAGVWTNSLSYGVGIRCEQNICDPAYAQPNTFTPLSTLTDSQAHRPLASTEGNSNEEQGQTIFKISVSATQPVGHYTGHLLYLAVPSL